MKNKKASNWCIVFTTPFSATVRTNNTIPKLPTNIICNISFNVILRNMK